MSSTFVLKQGQWRLHLRLGWLIYLGICSTYTLDLLGLAAAVSLSTRHWRHACRSHARNSQAQQTLTIESVQSYWQLGPMLKVKMATSHWIFADELSRAQWCALHRQLRHPGSQ